MASRDHECPLCTFLFTIAAEAAALARLPGSPKFAMYALHVSSFRGVFFDAEDYCWFPENDEPAVFSISPLYTFGEKAKDWALRHNGCFMLRRSQAQRESEQTAPQARELSSRVDLDVVRGWISHCERHHTHPDCNPSRSLALDGFCVIDCTVRSMVVCPVGNPYVTLSYVWGNEPAEDLGLNNMIPRTLPRVIEDAIQITMSLGYQYLWIDRYCISQADEKVKASLIRNMNKIYAESSITLIASASEKPSDGLVGVSAPRTDLPRSLRLGSLDLSQLVTNLADEVEKSRWNSRGWTYQEGFLSNKRLLFTKSQCYFQCGQLWCTEGLDIAPSTLSRLNRPGHAKMARFFPWVPQRRTSLVLSTVCDRRRQREEYFTDRVREYMRRELTHDSDAFDAFAGVLNYLEAFAEEFLLGNIFGLPVWSRRSRWSGHIDARDALLRSLSWTLSWACQESDTGTSLGVAIAERRNGIPSWTWCGWRQAISFSLPIEWMDLWLEEMGESDLTPETEVSVEYDVGETIPWKMDSNLVGLLAAGEAKGNARYIHIVGWVSQLVIPSGCWNDGPTTCQCGPYRLERKAVRCLSTAARCRNLPLAEHGGYDLKVWFFSPLTFSDTEDNCCGEVMVLVPSAEEGIYERLEALCKVEMEYFIRRPSIQTLADRFEWKWADFRIR